MHHQRGRPAAAHREDDAHSRRADRVEGVLARGDQEAERALGAPDGDPVVALPHLEELVAAGVPFEVVPGVSSFAAVPGAAGIPLTHRDHVSAFTVVTGHEDPGKAGSSVDWHALARTHGTKVVLMGVERLATITVALMEFAGGGELWVQPAALAGAQRFAFACLVPIGLLALWIAGKGRQRRPTSARNKIPYPR